ncbi:MAG: metallophosphoesterase family protein [Chlamydiia bacterium]|nr:metallophosphoesterase family protein [Chlamydiia bacterium]
MAEFVTSDLHLGHANIWTKAYADRPVYSTEEMNEFLITRWNETVSVNDTVYVLGDVCMGKIAESLPLCELLQGHKVLVFGNHDRMFRPKNDNQFHKWMTEYSQYFESITNEMVWNDRLLFNHFPYSGDSHDEDRYLSSRPQKSRLWLCHGHTHQKEFVSGPRQIHIGVDASIADYAPIPMDLVISTIQGEL